MQLGGSSMGSGSGMAINQGPDTQRIREDWSLRGKHWDQRADEVSKFADRFNAPLIGAAGISAGHHVLDMATGAGEPMMTVASLVGPSGSVLATDLVPEMLEGARRRVQASGLENVAFRVNDMCELPDADGSFDRAICRFGLMFVSDPVKAASEARRVLKPGGQVAYLVWGPRADTTMFEVFAEAADEIWGLDDPLIDLETMCRLGGKGTMEGILRDAGFDVVDERELRFDSKMPGELEFWHAQIDMSFGPKMDAATPDEQARAREVVRDKFQKYLKDGAYHMTAHVRIGAATKT